MSKVIALQHESGKTITVNTSGKQVALVVWRKHGGVLLPLALRVWEAKLLVNELQASIDEAEKPD